MRYGSVCSGIEAASVAWESLGWIPAWFSQFDPEHNYKNGPDFPSAVLAYHWPEVVNLGDMTKIATGIRGGLIEAPDVLVGGTPCQAFSIAGLRNGLSDGRGQLTLAFVELVNGIDEKRREQGKPPVIVVWENVPGVLSSKDNAFGCFLAGLAGESGELESPGRKWSNAGYVLGPERAIAWRVLDAQFFRVAQRRRRVFVVASARSGFDPAAVFFESQSLRRHSPPCRKTGAQVTSSTGDYIANGSHWDGENNPHPTLNQTFNIGGIGASNQELFSQRGCGIVLMAHGQGGAEIKTDDSAPTLTCNHEAPIAAYVEGTGWDSQEKRIHPVYGRTYPTLSSRSNGGGTVDGYISYPDKHSGIAIRRLTPRECERLQGFPDDHTLIPYGRTIRPEKLEADYAKYLMRGGKLSFEDCAGAAADGHRYRAIGNSMAVPVMNWIGRRIAEVLGA
ncbi:DNA cytosine methyltransferase [Yokenella regensburgei]|nr:DNA cytosine methyltransferase [Yokenella regensburgei]